MSEKSLETLIVFNINENKSLLLLDYISDFNESWTVVPLERYFLIDKHFSEKNQTE